MKTNRLAAMGLVALILILLVAIGLLWLGNAPLMPSTKAVNEAIPDDRIPH